MPSVSDSLLGEEKASDQENAPVKYYGEWYIGDTYKAC